MIDRYQLTFLKVDSLVDGKLIIIADFVEVIRYVVRFVIIIRVLFLNIMVIYYLLL